MKTTFFVLALASALIGSTALHADTLEVRADLWPPYNAEPGAALPGYIIEILHVAFPSGTVSYKITPWPRAVKELNENKIDAIIGALKAEATGAIFPDEEQGHTDDSFFVAPSNPWRYTGIDSLKKVRVAGAADYAYDGGPVDAYLKTATLPAVQLLSGNAPLENNIKMLKAGRVDVIIEDPAVIHFTLKKLSLPPTTLVIAGTVTPEPKPIYVAFAAGKPESKSRAAQLSATVIAMRADGRLAALLAKYGLCDWSK